MSSNVNIPSLKNNSQIQFQQKDPTMQGTGYETVQDAAAHNYVANRLNASKEADPRVKAALTAGVWYGIAQGMEKFNNSLNGKEFADTAFGKVGAFGDRVAGTYVGKKFESGLSWLDKLYIKAMKKSRILRSLRYHSTSPEWGWAKMPMQGPNGFWAMDTESVMEQFLEPITKEKKILGFKYGTEHSFQELGQYGNFTQDQINAFKASLKGKTKEEITYLLQKKELELLNGSTPGLVKANMTLEEMQNLAKELKAKKLGFASMAEYEAMKGKFGDHLPKLKRILAKADPNLKVSIWRNNTTPWGKFMSHLFGRQVGTGELKNKATLAVTGGAKSKIGKFLNKSLKWLMEGGTNRFGGGKLCVFLQAGIFADMLYYTFSAPKGEKIKTFTERFTNDFMYFIGSAFGIRAMHKVGGFKYAGLDNRGRIEYQKALKEFNKNVDEGLLNSKELYKNAERALDKKLGAENIKNPITKLLHKLGKFINWGNESKHVYKSKSKFNLNWLRKLGNKNIIGVPLRIFIVLGALSPFMVKTVTKMCHAIFGKPTHSVLDEDEVVDEGENGAIAVEGNDSINNPNASNPFNGQNVPTGPRDPNSYQSDSNLIKNTMNNGGVNPYKPQNNVQNESAQNPIEPERHYIPSPQGVIIQKPDMTKYDQAMAYADRTEAEIQRILAQ